MEFAPGHQGHDQQGGQGKDKPDKAFFSRFLPPEHPSRLQEHVKGKQDERKTHEAVNQPLAVFNNFRIGSPGLHGKPPEKRRCGRAFNVAVQSEADKGDAPGPQSGPEGNSPFQYVIGHGGRYQPKAQAPPSVKRGG